MLIRILICGFLLNAAFTAGCGGPQVPQSDAALPPPGDDPKVEALMLAWQELAKADFAELDVPRAMMLVQRMAELGPDGLTALLDLLGEENTPPVAKVLVVMSITPFIQVEHGPRLIALTQPDRETTTRACATHLLGFINTPQAEARLRELSQDPERRVRVEALLVRIMKGDRAALAKARDVWRDPETNERERTQLLLMIPEAEAAQFLDLFTEALSHPDLELLSLRHAVSMLGRAGTPSAVPALRACASSETVDPDLRALANSAADAIVARAQAEKKGSAPEAQDEGAPAGARAARDVAAPAGAAEAP